MSEISVTRLGAWLGSDPRRRQALRRGEGTWARVRYDRARRMIGRHLRGERCRAELEIEVRRLGRARGFGLEQRERALNAEALGRFLVLDEELIPFGAEVSRGPRGHALRLGGLDLSLAPEVLFRVRGQGWGAVQLYFGRGMPLSSRCGAQMASLLGHWLRVEGPAREPSERPVASLSVVVDVFAGVTHRARCLRSSERALAEATQELSSWR